MARAKKEIQEGYKEVSIISLKMVKEESVEYKQFEKKVINPHVVYDLFTDQLHLDEEPDEVFYMLTLNTKNTITGIFEVSRGTLNSSIVHPRDVFKRALLANANAILLVHNHPSGEPTPSKEDINITNRLADIGSLMGIKILDHIIIGEGTFISFKEENLI